MYRYMCICIYICIYIHIQKTCTAKNAKIHQNGSVLNNMSIMFPLFFCSSEIAYNTFSNQKLNIYVIEH